MTFPIRITSLLTHIAFIAPNFAEAFDPSQRAENQSQARIAYLDWTRLRSILGDIYQRTHHAPSGVVVLR